MLMGVEEQGKGGHTHRCPARCAAQEHSFSLRCDPLAERTVNAIRNIIDKTATHRILTNALSRTPSHHSQHLMSCE